jgi:KaiC/GvpD/RAD55 family RecA-like ATPase
MAKKIRNIARLQDAARRMLNEGKEEADIIDALQELGLERDNAEEIVVEVREGNAEEEKKKEPEGNFWETPSGRFFAGGKEVVGGAAEGEVTAQPEAATKPVKFRDILPLRVSDFDKLIDRGGLKRGDTILLSGGCGTGKTTFSMQSLYHGALHGERGVYITLEESAEKMKENMRQNFNWDIEGLEREGKLAIIKIDPLTIARAVEAMLTKERGGLYIEFKEFDLPFQLNLPFTPDRVVIDSLSALSIAFMENEQGYRQYLRHLFESLESFKSSNIVLGETEQEPGIYSRSGIEEFLADGVVVFYNIKIHNIRQKALEILKLRSSNHEKRIIPYKITTNGIEVFINEELFREE